jgi:hypothetical protein
MKYVTNSSSGKSNNRFRHLRYTFARLEQLRVFVPERRRRFKSGISEDSANGVMEERVVKVILVLQNKHASAW